MAQSPRKDNSDSKRTPESRSPAPEEEEDPFAELVETVAAAYFGACRKMARLFNRNKR